jgi:hypothetical protein
MKWISILTVVGAIVACASANRDPAGTSGGFQCKASGDSYEWQHVASSGDGVLGRCETEHSSVCVLATDENGYPVTCTKATVGKFVQ